MEGREPDLLDRAPLAGPRRVEPELAPVDLGADDDVIEGEGRRVPRVQGGPRVRVDERGPRRDAELPEEGHEEERLVLAVAEAPAEDFAGRVRAVGAGPHLEADVPDLLLDEAEGGGGALARGRGRRGDPPRLGADRLARVARRVERHGPQGDLLPRRELRELHPRPRVEPRRQVGVGEERRDVARFPDVLRERADVAGGRGRDVAVRPREELPPLRPEEAVADVRPGRGAAHPEAVEVLPAEDRVGAAERVGVLDDVAGPNVLEDQHRRQRAVVEVRRHPGLALEDPHLLPEERVDPPALPDDARRVKRQRLVGRVPAEREPGAPLDAGGVRQLAGVVHVELRPGRAHLVVEEEERDPVAVGDGPVGRNGERRDPGGRGTVARRARGRRPGREAG